MALDGNPASMGIILAIVAVLFMLLSSSAAKKTSNIAKTVTEATNDATNAVAALVPTTFSTRSADLKKKEVSCDECLARVGNACLQEHFDVKNLRSVSWTDLFLRMGDLAEKIQTIVEIGTSHLGEKSCIDTGCSTVLFGQWVKNRNELFANSSNRQQQQIPPAKLFSVDESESKIQTAKNVYGKYPNVIRHIEFVHSDPQQFIMNFNKPIDVLYIDSSKLVDKNVDELKRVHLAEIRAAIPKLSKHAFVIIDNAVSGQGDMVIQELSAKGFRILMDDFQVILCKPVISDAAKNEISMKSEWMADSVSVSQIN